MIIKRIYNMKQYRVVSEQCYIKKNRVKMQQMLIMVVFEF